MTTFADIQKAAEGIVSTSIDDVTPVGHFVATAKVHGHSTTYLLEGELVILACSQGSHYRH